MKSTCKWRSIFAVVFLFVVLNLIWQTNVFAQVGEGIPERFINLSSRGATFQAKFAEADRQFKSNPSGDRYWVGYRFALHDGIDFSKHGIYIHDNGGISFFKGDGGHWFWEEADEDLETSVHRALAELGEEASKQFLEKRWIEYSQEKEAYAVYFLINSGSGKVVRTKFLDFRHADRLRDIPVFWFGVVDTDQSFDYVRGLVENTNNSKRIRKPALFLASLHDSPRVIPYLVQVAGNENEYELQKKAIFWLGQIPKEESFTELNRMFAREKDRKLKEEIVFSVSQHQSEKVTGKLAEIAQSDPDEKVREKAIFWLGQSEKEERLQILKDMFAKTESTFLRKKIIFSISQHRSEQAPGFLIEIAESENQRDVRREAIFWLGQIAGKKTLQTLRGIVEEGDDAEVQAQAVFALSQHRDKQEAAKMLIDIAKNHHSAKVRKKAIFWLSQTDDEQALAFFKEILGK